MYQGGRAGAGRGFSSLKSNLGFGFSALKGDPKTVLGFNQLQSLGRNAQAIRPGNVGTLGRSMTRTLGRWGTAADLAGQGKLRALAVGSRIAAPGVATLAGLAGADFLNPWGLGWGD
jgi:hypothetical protein